MNAMKPSLDLLQKVQRVQVDPTLFARIEQQINERKKMVINRSWLRVAAVFAIMLLSSETYFFIHHLKQQHPQEISSMAYNPAFSFSYE